MSKENLHKAKTPLGGFQVTTPKESINHEQAVTSIRNLNITRLISKYQPAVDPLLQSPIGLNLIEAFSFAQISASD